MHLEHLVLDANGTLTDRGEPIVCMTTRLQRLRETLTLHALSVNTFATARSLAASLGVGYRHITNSDDNATTSTPSAHRRK